MDHRTFGAGPKGEMALLSFFSYLFPRDRIPAAFLAPLA
jgi:hypothetical protein